MTRVALLLPLLLVLTACGDTPDKPPPTSWLQLVDRNLFWLFILAVFALACWSDRGRKS
jgi:hypothetical protein